MTEARPSNCRNALRDAGKPYPRSGCLVCRDGGLMGCPYERGAPPMKPTPEMIEAHAIADAKFAGMDFAALGRADKKRYLERSACCLSAALSVPAAAVVGEPEGWKLVPIEPTPEMESKGADAFFSPQPQSIEDENARAASVYRRMLSTAPSAPDGWQPIETAPHACHVIACYFYECEWIYDVVLSPPSPPFTHWKMLPAPPALGGASHE